MKQKSLAGLSLRDLEYVEAVAELKHFGRAAERCGVSQPALSEQIRKLEAHLGVVFFERTQRRVAVTPQGALLLAQVERVLAEARHFIAMGGQRQAAGLSGLLQLGAIETLGPYYLPGVLKLLREVMPEVALRLTENRTATLIERLRHGMLDVVLMVPVPQMPGLVAANLFFEPFVLATPKLHPLGHLPRITLDALPIADLLLLEEGHCLRDQALALCAGAPAATRHATSLETLWHMIAAGEGYSLLPALAVAARPEISDLVQCRTMNEPNAGRSVALVWRASDPRETQFRQLAALLRHHAPEVVERCS
ncbi:MAG: LysR substrate-binding domain-containing protein [Acidocella sp.]|nr:LysR substrate-binding domain-containing protein [Acidocella sp.]